MNTTFALTEEQELLRTTARRFLEARAGSDVVRDLMMTDAAFDPDLWKGAAELGWMSLAIPEAYGGAGYSFAELSVVLEEQGRALFCGPFLASVVLAANAILLGGDEAQRVALLPGIAAGDAIATLAVEEHATKQSAASVETTATRDAGGWVLAGTKRYVLGAGTATTIIVAARTGDAEDAIGLFVVPADAAGVTVTWTPTLDATRKAGEVALADVHVGADALLGGNEAAWSIVTRVRELGSAAVACELAGLTQRCLEMSLDYAKTRFQFGRPIGSFQAIKHRLADDLVASEQAKSTAYHAARSTEDADEFPIASRLAKTVCSNAATTVTGDTIQIHGGIGFTWEHDAHLYFKRAKAGALSFGGQAHQRAELADLLGF